MALRRGWPGVLRWLLVALAALVGLVVVAILVGWLLPETHVARSSIALHQPVDTVWMLVRDFERYPEWWDQFVRVEPVPEPAGREVWSFHDKRGQSMPIEVIESEPPRRVVTRIASDELPFGGTWTYEIVESAGGSLVTVTEAGEIYNPFFRTAARFVVGYHMTIDDYLRSLARRVGEEATPLHER